MIVCLLLPRFALVVAAGGRGDLLREPAALAPEAGGEQRVGEVSPAAQAFGVHAGMRLGEALAQTSRQVNSLDRRVAPELRSQMAITRLMSCSISKMVRS